MHIECRTNLIAVSAKHYSGKELTQPNKPFTNLITACPCYCVVCSGQSMKMKKQKLRKHELLLRLQDQIRPAHHQRATGP